MRTITNLFLATLFAAGFAACSSDSPDGPGSSSSSVKMNRLNLDNAQYLTLGEGGGSRANSTETLFKVDANGNTSVVMLECVETEDGSTKNTTYNLEVQPASIYNLTSSWMFMRDCNFYCSTSEEIGWKLKSQYTTPSNSFYFNILANKKSGKVYFVPDDYAQYFYYDVGNGSDCSEFFAEASNGDLYSATQQLAKITVTNDGAVIKNLSPVTHQMGGTKPYPLSNGAVVMIPYPNQIQVVYPNGGFEDIYYSSNAEPGNPIYGTSLRVEGIFPYEDNIFNMVLTDYNSEDNTNTVELRTLSIGSSYGSVSMSQPVLSHPYTYGNVVPFYMGQKYLIFGDHLAYDKASGGWIELDGNASSTFITPQQDNIYNGRAWRPYSDCTDWMDLNTLETGRTWFDIPTGILYDKMESFIPSGEVFVYGTDPSEGKYYVYRVNLMSGSSTKSELYFDSPTITLVPLN